jgi:hypothetical protein
MIKRVIPLSQRLQAIFILSDQHPRLDSENSLIMLPGNGITDLIKTEENIILKGTHHRSRSRTR